MKIIAVTSCPVGMAHTFMAAAALKKAAKKQNFDVKVETQGAMGIQNRLTPSDVEAADLFIDAADVALQEAERFKDCVTFKVATGKLIKKTEATLKEAFELIEE